MPTNKENWYRLISKTDFNGDYEACWNWQGTFFSSKSLPYGQFWYKGTNWSAHRAVLDIVHGEIPEGCFVLHRCNNSKCVNPGHLYFGDHKRNMKDRDEARHTSKGEHRYNFKQTDNLKEKVKQMRLDGYGVNSITEALGIGRQTYYRIRKSMDDFPKEHRKFRK